MVCYINIYKFKIMELGQLIVGGAIIYAIMGVVSVMIYDAMNEINYKMEVFEGFIVWLFWPIMMILFIAYSLYNIKNGCMRVFENIKYLFKR